MNEVFNALSQSTRIIHLCTFWVVDASCHSKLGCACRITQPLLSRRDVEPVLHTARPANQKKTRGKRRGLSSNILPSLIAHPSKRLGMQIFIIFIYHLLFYRRRCVVLILIKSTRDISKIRKWRCSSRLCVQGLQVLCLSSICLLSS